MCKIIIRFQRPCAKQIFVFKDRFSKKNHSFSKTVSKKIFLFKTVCKKIFLFKDLEPKEIIRIQRLRAKE